MKIKCMHIPVLAYFLIDTPNWEMLWGKKYLSNSLHKKLKNKRFLKQT